MRLRNILLVICLWVPSFARAEDEFAGVEFKTTKLADQIYMLEGAGGNITAALSKEGTFLVDDDFKEIAPKLVQALRSLGGESPRYIVNTHFHYDHTGGNEVFGGKATIFAATAARDRLMSEQTLWKKQHPALPAHAWPNVTFEESLELHLGGEKIRMLHLRRGHTDGDTIVFFTKGKVVSLGDLYFAGMYPIFHPEHAGSLMGYLANLDAALKLISEDARIVPGHGPVTGKAELKRYRAMIAASIAQVKRGLRAGRSLEQLQAAGLPKEWDDFSHGYVTTDRWIAMLFAALRAGEPARDRDRLGNK